MHNFYCRPSRCEKGNLQIFLHTSQVFTDSPHQPNEENQEFEGGELETLKQREDNGLNSSEVEGEKHSKGEINPCPIFSRRWQRD